MGVGPERIREINSLRILHWLIDGSETTATEIAEHCDLSRTSVNAALANLRELGWITTLNAVTGTAGGRPARRYRFRSEGAVVLGNPSNGSAYLWSVAGVRVVYPSRPEPPGGDLLWLGRHLDEIGTNPRVCGILAQRGARYYYTDDTVADGATGGGREPLWGQALDRLPRQYLEAVDRTPDGAVTLWRITACD